VNGVASHIVWGHFWTDGIDGYMGPSVGLTTTASGGVGWGNLGAGVRLKDLSLINVSLGNQAKVRYTNRWDASLGCVADLDLASRLNLGLRTLSGEIQLFATVNTFIFGRFTVTDDIAKWSGVYKNYLLGSYANSYPAYSPSCIWPAAAPQFQGIIVG
jgi:hypothetical protein